MNCSLIVHCRLQGGTQHPANFARAQQSASLGVPAFESWWASRGVHRGREPRVQHLDKFDDASGWARASNVWGYSGWFRVLIGALELAAALLLLWPRTAVHAGTKSQHTFGFT
jgi:hypothetical protein